MGEGAHGPRMLAAALHAQHMTGYRTQRDRAPAYDPGASMRPMRTTALCCVAALCGVADGGYFRERPLAVLQWRSGPDDFLLPQFCAAGCGMASDWPADQSEADAGQWGDPTMYDPLRASCAANQADLEALIADCDLFFRAATGLSWQSGVGVAAGMVQAWSARSSCTPVVKSVHDHSPDFWQDFAPTTGKITAAQTGAAARSPLLKSANTARSPLACSPGDDWLGRASRPASGQSGSAQCIPRADFANFSKHCSRSQFESSNARADSSGIAASCSAECRGALVPEHYKCTAVLPFVVGLSDSLESSPRSSLFQTNADGSAQWLPEYASLAEMCHAGMKAAPHTAAGKTAPADPDRPSSHHWLLVFFVLGVPAGLALVGSQTRMKKTARKRASSEESDLASDVGGGPSKKANNTGGVDFSADIMLGSFMQEDNWEFLDDDASSSDFGGSSADEVWCGGGGVDEMDSAMEAHELHALQSIAAQPCADAGAAAAAAGFRPCGDASFMDVQYDLDTMMALEDAKIQRGMMSQTGPTVNPGGIGDWAQSVGAGKQEEKRPSAAAKKRAPRVRKKKETAGRPVHPPIIIDEGAVNGKPFRCPYPDCKYAGARRRYVGEHMRTHTGAKPHKCPWEGCSYAAPGSGHLIRHMAVHTGKYKHMCKHPGCNYGTAQATHLTEHVRMHSGDKPFKCPHAGCQHGFTRSWHVARHMKLKHPAGEATVAVPPGLETPPGAEVLATVVVATATAMAVVTRGETAAKA